MKKYDLTIIGLVAIAVLLIGAVVVGALRPINVNVDTNVDAPVSVPRSNEPSSLGGSSPDFPTGYITLGGGAGIMGAWQPLSTATSTLCSPNSSQSGLFATSTLFDSIVDIDATSTANAVISWHKITSAYSSGFSTSTAATELASTTVDLSLGSTFSLKNATNSIFSDIDTSHFQTADLNAWNNIWNPLTDRLLVNIDAKNVDKAGGADSETFNLTGSCATYWLGAR